jgi:DNA polymerase I
MKKGDVEAKDMRKMWESQDQRFFDYAKQDALIVLALIRDLKIIDKYIALSMLTGALLQDVVDGGQTVLIEALLFREFRKNDRVMPMRPQRSEEDEEETFTGATVIPPKIGLTEHVLTHDMTSLYPTTIISKNICVSTLLIDDLGCKKITSPDGVGFVDHSVYHGILPRILRRLFDARIEAKKLMKTKTGIEKEALDARQYGLKIMMNSFYGWLGYKRSRLYKREVAAAVTSFGRENLEYVKRFLEENYHVEVVGGDTDSIWSRVGDLGAQENYAKLGKEIADAVTKTLPEPMGLAYENYMKKLLIVAKKRYAGLIVNDDGNQTVKIKGLEVIRRDFCPMTSNMLEDLLDIILKDGDIEKAIKRVQQDVHRIEGVVDMSVQGHLTKEMMEPLTLTRRYRGGEGHKTMQPHDIVAINVKKRGDKEYVLGDRIPFAITIGRGSLMSDNHIGGNTMRERAEDIDYIIKNNYIIDGKWYVEHQLIPPALRLLSPFNIDKEVLFCRKSYVQTSRKKKLRGLTWDDILPILRPGAQKSTS